MASATMNGNGFNGIAVLFEQLHQNIEEINKCVQNLNEIKNHDEAMLQLESERSSYVSETEKKQQAEDDEIAAKRAAEDEARRKEREEKNKVFHDVMDEEMAKLEDDIAAKLEGGHVDLQDLLEKRKDINERIDAEMQRPLQFPTIPIRKRGELGKSLQAGEHKSTSPMTEQKDNIDVEKNNEGIIVDTEDTVQPVVSTDALPIETVPSISKESDQEISNNSTVQTQCNDIASLSAESISGNIEEQPSASTASAMINSTSEEVKGAAIVADQHDIQPGKQEDQDSDTVILPSNVEDVNTERTLEAVDIVDAKSVRSQDEDSDQPTSPDVLDRSATQEEDEEPRHINHVAETSISQSKEQTLVIEPESIDNLVRASVPEVASTTSQAETISESGPETRHVVRDMEEATRDSESSVKANPSDYADVEKPFHYFAQAIEDEKHEPSSEDHESPKNTNKELEEVEPIKAITTEEVTGKETEAETGRGSQDRRTQPASEESLSTGITTDWKLIPQQGETVVPTSQSFEGEVIEDVDRIEQEAEQNHYTQRDVAEESLEAPYDSTDPKDSLPIPTNGGAEAEKREPEAELMITNLDNIYHPKSVSRDGSISSIDPVDRPASIASSDAASLHSKASRKSLLGSIASLASSARAKVVGTRNSQDSDYEPLLSNDQELEESPERVPNKEIFVIEKEEAVSGLNEKLAHAETRMDGEIVDLDETSSLEGPIPTAAQVEGLQHSIWNPASEHPSDPTSYSEDLSNPPSKTHAIRDNSGSEYGDQDPTYESTNTRTQDDIAVSDDEHSYENDIHNIPKNNGDHAPESIEDIHLPIEETPIAIHPSAYHYNLPTNQGTEETASQPSLPSTPTTQPSSPTYFTSPTTIHQTPETLKIANSPHHLNDNDDDEEATNNTISSDFDPYSPEKYPAPPLKAPHSPLFTPGTFAERRSMFETPGLKQGSGGLSPSLIIENNKDVEDDDVADVDNKSHTEGTAIS